MRALESWLFLISVTQIFRYVKQTTRSFEIILKSVKQNSRKLEYSKTQTFLYAEKNFPRLLIIEILSITLAGIKKFEHLNLIDFRKTKKVHVRKNVTGGDEKKRFPHGNVHCSRHENEF